MALEQFLSSGLRGCVLRVLTNRRLWRRRFDPLHPGLLLLKQTISSAVAAPRPGNEGEGEDGDTFRKRNGRVSYSGIVGGHDTESESDVESDKEQADDGHDADEEWSDDSDDTADNSDDEVEKEKRRQWRIQQYRQRSADEKLRIGALWRLLKVEDKRAQSAQRPLKVCSFCVLFFFVFFRFVSEFWQRRRTRPWWIRERGESICRRTKGVRYHIYK